MKQPSKPQVWMPLLFSITLIAGMLLGYRIRDHIPGRPFFSVDKSRPLQEMMDLIRSRYVDTINMQQLADTAVSAILAKLDPHSIFIPADELAVTQEEITGRFSGIGVEFSILNDTIHVLQVIPGGPSAKAGLQTGDRLTRVNDSNVAGVHITEDRIKRLLRGGHGTEVQLQVLRGGTPQQFRFSRGIIPVSSVDAAYEIAPGTGYIRLNKFTQATYREFMEVLEPLTKKGMRQLILDLRNNGGGVLDQAVEIADEFIDGDKLITYTEGLHFPRKEYRCKRPGLFEKGKLVVLADEGSASASEIILGALQDWNRATIIGRRSFGKGLVQEQYDLSDGSALRLTVARYYTPVGRSIQRPYNQGEKAYYEEAFNRYQKGEADTAPPAGAPLFTTPSGRKVAGGGGIYPDIRVEEDSTLYPSALSRLYMEGSFTRIAYRYYLANRSELQQFKNADSFVAGFNFPETAGKTIREEVLTDSVNMDTLSKKASTLLYDRLKAALARQLWRNEGYFRTVNHNDPLIMKALDYLSR
jgi:carboxyl-terminal processing protease